MHYSLTYIQYELALLARAASCCSFYICTRAFGPRYEGKLLLVIKIWGTYLITQTYLSRDFANNIFGISVPDIPPVEQLKATLYDYLGNSVYFVYFIYIHINNVKFTYDKFKTAKFGFHIFDTSALRELLWTLYLYSGLRPSVWGKVTSDNWF